MTALGLICIAVAIWILASEVEDAADTIAEAIRDTIPQQPDEET